jgi:hypothetical protein
MSDTCQHVSCHRLPRFKRAFPHKIRLRERPAVRATLDLRQWSRKAFLSRWASRCLTNFLA